MIPSDGGVQQPGCGESVIESIEKEHGSVLFGMIISL